MQTPLFGSLALLLVLAPLAVAAPGAKAPPVAIKAPTTAAKLAALPAGDFDAALLAVLRAKFDYAKLHDADGDAFLASGDPKNALVHYLKAMSEVGAGGFFNAWKLEVTPEGHRVIEVTEGKRAARGGLKVGDLLVSVDDHSLVGLDAARRDILLYSMEGVPVRPHVFSVKRAGKTLEIRIDRSPSLKVLSNQQEVEFRDALERKILDLMIARKLEPKVNENMKSAAKSLQENLKNAKGGDDIKFAAEDVRGGTFANPGWAENYFNCGVLLEAAGEAAEAEKCFRNFLLMRPKDSQASAIRSRFASLGAQARAEQLLVDWEGSWHITRNGAKTERGYIFERSGKILKVKNFLGEQWMTATITDEFNASALQILTAKAMSGGPLEGLLNKCFGGKIEAAGSLKLSPDKKTMTVTINNDIDIDPANCAMLRQNPSTTSYVR
jgi:tetratricopeptide (TPR) repeat protein